VSQDLLATRIDPTSFRGRPMQTFHLGWIALFVTSFSWLGSAALLPLVQRDLGLGSAQTSGLLVGSLAAAFLGRFAAGTLCDRFGPRRIYTALLAVVAAAATAVALAPGYDAIQVPWVLLGLAGASLVVTQYHTTLVFAPSCAGAASAAAMGWGAVGGGIARVVVVIAAQLAVTLGVGATWGWRMPMLVAALACAVTAVAYGVLARDTPEGDFHELRRVAKLPPLDDLRGGFARVARNHRVWTLSAVHAVCFGLEVAVMGVAVLYSYDRFGLGLGAGGLVAAGIVVMNPLARTLGGAVADWFASHSGRRGRVTWLSLTLFGQGATLILFSQAATVGVALAGLVLFSLCVQMAHGATFAIVPTLDRRAAGSVTGIVAAGGLLGAALASALRGVHAASWPTALLVLGVLVMASSGLVLLARLQEQQALRGARPPVLPAGVRTAP